MNNKNKIICLIGKSNSGKDTILNYIVNNYNFEPSISFTTRPIRPHETDGKEYYFIDDKLFKEMIDNNDLIEYRKYNTLVDNVPEVWYYGLHRYLNNIDLNKHPTVVIMDVNGCRSLIKHFGRDNVFVVYINASDDVRKQRCIMRGDFNEYEWDRRLKDDDNVFNLNSISDIIDMPIFNDGNNDIKTISNLIISAYNINNK